MTGDVPVRHASTIILVRDAGEKPSVLMGQRGRGAVFMPDKFVFPGGAVDVADAHVSLVEPLQAADRERLTRANEDGPSPEALAVAAIRELWEETGLRLGATTDGSVAAAWPGFDALPSADALRFFFRALTPVGRPRRFDARFFLAPAEALLDPADALADATDELSHLSWVPLADARRLDLAFITEIVLAELTRHLPSLDAPETVPFVRNDRFDDAVIWL